MNPETTEHFHGQYKEQIEDTVDESFAGTSLTPTDIELHKEQFVKRVMDTLEEKIGENVDGLRSQVEEYFDSELERKMKKE
jgi:RNA binding exosome subunit